MGDGFYRSKDPTNSIKVLKEDSIKELDSKLAKQQGADDEASSHDAVPNLDAGISPQRKRKRCSLRSETVPNIKHVCFFCDLPARTEKLHFQYPHWNWILKLKSVPNVSMMTDLWLNWQQVT